PEQLSIVWIIEGSSPEPQSRASQTSREPHRSSGSGWGPKEGPLACALQSHVLFKFVNKPSDFPLGLSIASDGFSTFPSLLWLPNVICLRTSDDFSNRSPSLSAKHHQSLSWRSGTSHNLSDL